MLGILVSADGEVLEFSSVPTAPHGPIDPLVWAAPGTLAGQAVATAWRTGGLTGLGGQPGPWAIAIVDGNDLLLASDPLGVQPLFWAETADGRIIASSWLARIVDRPDIPDGLDYEGVLLANAINIGDERTQTRTPFTAVRQVPGGHALRVRPDGSKRLIRYWDPADLPGPDSSLSLADASALLRERIDAAIRRLTPTDVPVGAHVSGGLDASAIACRAHDVLAESGGGLVAGYSWAPSEADVPLFGGDERNLLRDIEKWSGFPIRTVDHSVPETWFSTLDPNRYVNSTHFRERWTLRQAHDDGVRVLLSGWGGDDLASFNGYLVTAQLLRRGHVATALREASTRIDVTSSAPVDGRTRARRLAGLGLAALPPGAVTLRRPRESVRDHRRRDEIAMSLRGLSDLAADNWLRNTREFRSMRDHHARMLAMIRRGHLQHRTTWWHQTGRLMGIQYRYPLLDLDVVAAALALPWWALRSHGWDRSAFRLAVAPWVPETVAWNVTKDEPSLFTPPKRTRHIPDMPPRLLPGDAAYEAAIQLAMLTWELDDAGDDPPHRGVWARPDLAPNVHQKAHQTAQPDPRSGGQPPRDRG